MPWFAETAGAAAQAVPTSTPSGLAAQPVPASSPARQIDDDDISGRMVYASSSGPHPASAAAMATLLDVESGAVTPRQTAACSLPTHIVQDMAVGYS